jgi:hypothetical protein
MEEKRPGEYMPVFENERGTFIFNSKDLCMIEYIPELINAGVHDPLQLALGRAELPVLPGDAHPQQQDAVEKKQACDGALDVVHQGAAHQTGCADDIAQGAGALGPLLADGLLGQVIQGLESGQVVVGFVHKGIDGIAHRITPFWAQKNKTPQSPPGLQGENEFRGTT